MGIHSLEEARELLDLLYESACEHMYFSRIPENKEDTITSCLEKLIKLIEES